MKFMFGLQHPLTCNPSTTLSNPCNKVRGNYVVKEVFLCLPSCFLSSCVLSSCVFLRASLLLSRYDTANEYITLPRYVKFSKHPLLAENTVHAVWYLFFFKCRAISTDISDPPSPHLPIVHCFRQVLKATFRILTLLLYVCSSWTSCLCSSLWRGPQEYITYELFSTSPPVSRMSGTFILIVFVMGGGGCTTAAL